MMAAYRSPSVRYAVIADAGLNCARSVCSVINSCEFIAAGIKSTDILIYMEYRVVISAFTVFGLVVNSTSLDFNLADGEVPLEI